MESGLETWKRNETRTQQMTEQEISISQRVQAWKYLDHLKKVRWMTEMRKARIEAEMWSCKRRNKKV